MHLTTSLALALLASLLLPDLAGAQPIVVRHAQGETTLQAPPKRVMATDWAAFDNLTALGIPVAGVPAGVAPRHLADKLSDDMLRIGSLQEPDIEGIAAARPDLAIIGGRSRASYGILSRIVPTLDSSVDNSDILEGVKANLRSYGEIFGRQERAAELIANLDAKVEAARAAAQGRGTGLAIVANAGKMGIYGPKSRVSWIYATLNMPSVFDEVDDRDHGGDAITFEYLLQADPDWLFVVDRDAGVGDGDSGAARRLLDNELVRQTKFWTHDRVIYLDPSASYVTMHGYDSLMLLLDQVTAGFAAK